MTVKQWRIAHHQQRRRWWWCCWV